MTGLDKITSQIQEEAESGSKQHRKKQNRSLPMPKQHVRQWRRKPLIKQPL